MQRRSVRPVQIRTRVVVGGGKGLLMRGFVLHVEGLPEGSGVAVRRYNGGCALGGGLLGSRRESDKLPVNTN